MESAVDVLHHEATLPNLGSRFVKVLLVDLEPAWRGGQNQALLILTGLKDRGHFPELVAATGSELGKRSAAAGIPVHFVSRGLFRFPAASKIRTIIGGKQFDIVHANEAHAVTAVWLSGAARQIPFIISRRVGYPISGSFLGRARYNAANRIAANSQWVANQAAKSGISRDKLTVVYEGTAIPPQFTAEQREAARKRWGISPGDRLLGCVGVLLPDKGQEWLIRSLPLIQQEFPHTRLILAGAGPCRAQLEEIAAELRLIHSVIFAGFVADVENVYAALDVFLLPSFFEALNNSLLAAMSYEIPSIAFRRGALGEIIEHENSGLLVSGPDTAEISAAVCRILRDATFAKNLAQAGRKRVEDNFSADNMVYAMIRTYQMALNRSLKP
jgi:glycosyltransferase involved in cell wall biosynthesis